MHPDAQEIIDALEDNRDWWLKQIPDSPNLVDKTKDNFMSEEAEEVSDKGSGGGAGASESAGPDSQPVPQAANDARDRGQHFFISIECQIPKLGLHLLLSIVSSSPETDV